MKKVIRPGAVKYDWYYGGKRKVDVFINIEFEDNRLSLTGVIGPNQWGNCVGSCGQIDSSFRDGSEKLVDYASGWNRAKFQKLLDIWDKWHLNDMRAGSPKQEAYLKQINDQFPGYPASHYEWASQKLAEAGLNPDDGYLYGHAWLFEEVPQDVINWLFTLPNADKTPAWV